MAIIYTYKFTKCSLETVPNDVLIQIESYLADPDDLPFIDLDTNELDLFTVEITRSALPAVSDYDSYLSIITHSFINEKYNKTIGGTLIVGSTIVSDIETDGIVAGQFVTGTGIPAGTTVSSIRNQNSLRLSQAATEAGTQTLSFSTNGWSLDFSEISRLTDIVDFSAL